MLSVTLGMGATAATIHRVDAEEIACMTADTEAHHAAELSDAESDEMTVKAACLFFRNGIVNCKRDDELRVK